MVYYGLEYISKLIFGHQLGSISGLENLPSPPCIIAANHVSPYDPILLVLQLYTWIKKYGKKPVFLTNRKVIVLFAAFTKVLGMFPGTKRGLKQAQGFLSQGIPIGIFPNRDRIPNRIKRFHLGPAYLSSNAKVPIVPIGIRTKDEVFPSWNLWKIIKSFFHKKHFIIGEPIYPDDKISLTDLTNQLTVAVARLIGKEVI
ncbi:MAG: 1-acyl-sn-glycerol-3-phosphate acyltransferase [candidate division WOR-3 bacterium]|nr:1-acyl-sn-glycerol-3-phosphate acyltransferase [candidate division WOR-3 bacterium]